MPLVPFESDIAVFCGIVDMCCSKDLVIEVHAHGEVSLRFDDFAQSGIHALNGIGGVDHPPDVGRERKGRNQFVSSPAPGSCHGRELHTPWSGLKRLQLRQFGLGTGSGVDWFVGRRQRLAVFPARVVQAVANQVSLEPCHAQCVDDDVARHVVLQ